jgi:hypothetical protein
VLESVIARDREGKEGRACGAMPGCGVGGPHPLCSGHPAAKVLAAAARARPAHRAPAELSRGVSTPADCTPTPPSPTTIFVFSSLPFLPSRASDTVLPLAKKEREAYSDFMQGSCILESRERRRPMATMARALQVVVDIVCGYEGMRCDCVCLYVVLCLCMWCMWYACSRSMCLQWRSTVHALPAPCLLRCRVLSACASHAGRVCGRRFGEPR